MSVPRINFEKIGDGLLGAVVLLALVSFDGAFWYEAIWQGHWDLLIPAVIGFRALAAACCMIVIIFCDE